MNKKWFVLPILALVTSLATGCIIVSDDDDSTLTISNRSSFALQDIAVGEVGAPEFGPNLVGGDLLLPGEDLVVTLSCGTYDVLIEDETGAQCQLGALDLCFDDAVWIIDDTELATCPFVPALHGLKKQ